MVQSDIDAGKVLFADDDADLQTVVGFSLHSAGFEVVKASTGAQVIELIQQQVFSLLVLDINMPQLNGLEVCTQVRSRSNVPVMMLSARNQERDLLDALAAGADAYMIKPFSPRALIARLRALLRRASPDEPRFIHAGGYRLDVEAHALQFDTSEVRLTKLENRLLQLLMSNAGQTVTTKALLAEVWSTYSTANRNMLKQIVFRLRRKLALEPRVADLLRTTPEGYVWADESQIAGRAQAQTF